MSNIYYDSQKVIAMLESEEIPSRSIVSLKYPSGNSLAVRVHAFVNGKLKGCAMQWDNGVTETFDLTNCLVGLVEKSTQPQSTKQESR